MKHVARWYKKKKSKCLSRHAASDIGVFALVNRNETFGQRFRIRCQEL